MARKLTPIYDRLSVVLVSTRNPLNIGAAARAMSNFGCSDLRVVRPYDVAFREAKSAVGASHVLRTAAEHGDVAEAVADCSLVVGTTAARNRKLEHKLFSLKDGARLMRKHSDRIALLFGSEKRGLSNHDLSHCHWLLRIPAGEEHPSMNLGQAVAVCLYELARDTALPTKTPETSPANAAELDRLGAILREALAMAGYPKAMNRSSDNQIRALVRRLRLSEKDAQLLSGMLRQMLWTIRSK
jgi:tRNA/rRNA methyltransferase